MAYNHCEERFSRSFSSGLQLIFTGDRLAKLHGQLARKLETGDRSVMYRSPAIQSG